MISISVNLTGTDRQVRELCQKYWTIDNNTGYCKFTHYVKDLALAYELPDERAVTALVQQASHAFVHCQLCRQVITLRVRSELSNYYTPSDYRGWVLCKECRHDMKEIPDLSAFVRPMIHSQLKQDYYQKLIRYYPHVFPNISYMNLLNKEGKDRIYGVLLQCQQELKIPGSLFLELNFDYIICNEDYFPVLVVDYFEGTREENMRDIFKRNIMKRIKMPYLHIPSDRDRIFNPEFISILIGKAPQWHLPEQVTVVRDSKANSIKEE